MPYQAVVFDMDGTLLDTLEDIAQAMNHALGRHGLPQHPLAAYRWMVGSGARELARRAVPADTPEALRQQVLETFLAQYRTAWNRHTRLYPGIAELLDALTARGLALAVLTNKPQEFAQHCMDAYLAAWPFALTLGVDGTTPPKPHPAGPQRIMAHLGLPASAVLYLGDTDVDMHTARGAGMFAVGVTWGFRPEAELVAAGAQAILHHPLELLALLDAPAA